MEENEVAGRMIHHESMTSSPEEIGELIVALLPRLRRFARSLSRNQHDADDLAQVAVERALRHRGQFRAGANLSSWLFGIMKNAWIDEIRARRRRERVHAPEEAGLGVGDSSAVARDIALSVQAAMERLPDEQRMAIALVLVEGLSYRDAAQVMEVPIGTLTSRLARGRETLQALLGDGGST